jgi:zinc/manganese transport system permease protein
MLHQAFMQNALLAGTLVALACGLVGYFVVVRAQVFAGDALSHVAFTGALAAAAIGVDVRLGLFAASILVALGMAGIGEQSRADDVVIGTVFAWILGLGVLFLSIFTTQSSAGNGTVGVRALFGSILGLSRPQAVVAAAIGVAVSLLICAIARPLLFASVDPDVAAARGVPVRMLGFTFFALLGVCAGEATQAVGALLLLGLLAAPAGAAHRLIANPYAGLALSALLAVAATWIGLALSYHISSLPPSSAIIGVAVTFYALAELIQGLSGRATTRPTGAPGPLVADHSTP